MLNVCKMRPYSDDIRTRVVTAYFNGEGTQGDIAQRFNVSIGFVQKLLKRYRGTGTISAKHMGGSSPKVDSENAEFIMKVLDENPAASLSDLCCRLATERNIKVSRSTMCRTLRKCKRRRLAHSRISATDSSLITTL